ncbi:hypothetical protein WA026_009604 [Henosepilachna vigintioctopunctata]|uniref:Pickpocket protein 28-like n=1 Tax=Henosepilachna vigintioctopunctata TaxID=420089 RepID=A0AAW1TW65_9CUCU
MKMKSTDANSGVDSSEENRTNETTSGDIRTYIREYFKCSSIQGLSYFAKNISPLEVCWWITVLLVCLSGCSLMIKEIVDKWIESPVLVSLATNEGKISAIPFPAVTLCPETKITRNCLNYSSVLRSKIKRNLENISEIEENYFDYMAPLCRLENHVNSTRNESLEDYTDFLDKCKSVDLDEMQCQFLGVNKNCTEILSPIITDDGLCYTFNMLDVRDIYSNINEMKYFREGVRNPGWDIEKGYRHMSDNSYPIRVFQTGAQKSLVVTMFTKKSDMYASCQDFILQGAKISLHVPSTIPRPSQVSFPAGLDEMVTVSVTPSFTFTNRELKEYDPHKRYCFFERERRLKYFKRYTQPNCIMECWTNYTIGECGCVHFYMPRDKNANICGPAKMQCLKDAEDSFTVTHFVQSAKYDKINFEDTCDCLPSCVDLNYKTEISRGRWNWNDPTSTEARYLKKFFKSHHASSIRIFFKASQFLLTERSELYGIATFLSNAGGILGLFLGFSLFSLIEIVYFLTLRLVENRRRYGLWFGVIDSTN